MVDLTLKVRECDECGAHAVALDGDAAECAECDAGRYGEVVGSKTIQTSPETAEKYRENFPTEVMD